MKIFNPHIKTGGLIVALLFAFTNMGFTAVINQCVMPQASCCMNVMPVECGNTSTESMPSLPILAPVPCTASSVLGGRSTEVAECMANKVASNRQTVVIVPSHFVAAPGLNETTAFCSQNLSPVAQPHYPSVHRHLLLSVILI